MLEAKDTVITASEFEVLIQHIHGRKFPETEEELGELIADVCRRPVEAQAEITWKARGSEMVKWLEKHWVGDEVHTGQTLPAGYYLDFRIRREEWEAFKNEKTYLV